MFILKSIAAVITLIGFIYLGSAFLGSSGFRISGLFLCLYLFLFGLYVLGSTSISEATQIILRMSGLAMVMISIYCLFLPLTCRKKILATLDYSHPLYGCPFYTILYMSYRYKGLMYHEVYCGLTPSRIAERYRNQSYYHIWVNPAHPDIAVHVRSICFLWVVVLLLGFLLLFGKYAI